MAGTTVDPAPASVGVLGGTGALGRGLALRLARAGVAVAVGSRDAGRATERVRELAEGAGAAAERMRGVSNAEAATADLVVVALPADGTVATLAGLAETIADRVVLSTVVPLAFDDDGPHLAMAADGRSVAEQVADALPRARVVAGLHAVSSANLGDPGRVLDDDVPLCGDDAAVAAAAGVVAALGLRPVAAGPLRLARSLEALTPLLIAINQRHRSHAGIRLTGV